MEIKNTIKRLKETAKQLEKDKLEAKHIWLRSDLMTAQRSLELTIKNLETALENVYDYQGN